jgi:hypothetical protein
MLTWWADGILDDLKNELNFSQNPLAFCPFYPFREVFNILFVEIFPKFN